MLESLGEMPLPPYIKERLEDKERYQTVYERKWICSSTYSWIRDFTEELMQQIRDKGANIAPVAAR